MNVAGPKEEDYKLTIGARYTSDGKYDRGFSGSIAAVVLMPTTTSPAGFDTCVMDCLESISINTTGTNIKNLGFDESTRTLSLRGSDPDSVYEHVLQSLTYINKASSETIANIDTITIISNDGVGSTVVEVPVTVLDNNKRRRRSLGTSQLTRRRTTQPAALPHMK